MNYFRELLDRIREIRLSERLFYQQIKDIYATSVDYGPSDEMTLAFYREVQINFFGQLAGRQQRNSFTTGQCLFTANGVDVNLFAEQG